MFNELSRIKMMKLVLSQYETCCCGKQVLVFTNCWSGACLGEIALNTQRWQNHQLLYQLLGSYEWNPSHEGFHGISCLFLNLLLFRNWWSVLSTRQESHLANPPTKHLGSKKLLGKKWLDIPAIKWQTFSGRVKNYRNILEIWSPILWMRVRIFCQMIGYMFFWFAS